MDTFERFNAKFGKWYEGLFGGADSELRPKDVLRRITQAMEDNRKEGLDGKVYVPNKYVLELAVDDPDERDYLLSFLDEDELTSVLQRFMAQNHYHARGPLDFTIAEAPAAAPGTKREKLRVKVRFEKGELPPAPVPAPLAIAPEYDDLPTVAQAFPEDDDGTVPAVAWASLAITGPDGRKSLFSLAKHTVTIGRGRSAGNDLILDSDGQISKTHARLDRAPDGHWTVTDTGSTNGVTVGNARITGSRRLQDGDILTLGATTLAFHDTADDLSDAAHDPGTAPLRRARIVTPDGTSHVLASETLIGRAITADIVLSDPAASSRHARIVSPDPSHYAIEDLGSTHGTLLNGQPIPPGQRIPLTPGDTLRLGETDLRFIGASL